MSRDAARPYETILEHVKHLVMELLRHHPEVIQPQQGHHTFEAEGYKVTVAPEFVEWLREKVEIDKKEKPQPMKTPEDLARGFEAIAAVYTERAKEVRERSA